jgi:hypothetical protein
MKRPQLVHPFLRLSITSQIHCEFDPTRTYPKIDYVLIKFTVLFWLDSLTVFGLPNLLPPAPEIDINRPQLGQTFLHVSEILRIRRQWSNTYGRPRNSCVRIAL